MIVRFLDKRGEIMDREHALIERIAALETKVEELKQDIRDIQSKLNGYLDRRIRINIEAFVGRIIIGALVSSGALAALISWLFARR
jgi:hypothetical protein